MLFARLCSRGFSPTLIFELSPAVLFSLSYWNRQNMQHFPQFQIYPNLYSIESDFTLTKLH